VNGELDTCLAIVNSLVLKIYKNLGYLVQEQIWWTLCQSNKSYLWQNFKNTCTSEF